MSADQALVWVFGPLLLLAAAGMSLHPSLHARARTAVVAVPVLAAFVTVLFGIRIPAPSAPLAVLAALAVVACAVAGGSAVTTTVLALADRPGAGAAAPSDDEQDRRLLQALRTGPGARADGAAEHAPLQDGAAEHAQLRGGAAIGYLERLLVVGSVLLGRFEIVAVVVAVKGLGRFSELQSSALRERFIVGTLASGSWAGICALLVVLSG